MSAKNPPCVVETCDRRRIGGRWCIVHQKRIDKHGNPLAHIPIGAKAQFYPPKRCKAPGCKRTTKAAELCQLHYERITRQGHLGDPLPVDQRAVVSADDLWRWARRNGLHLHRDLSPSKLGRWVLIIGRYSSRTGSLCETNSEFCLRIAPLAERVPTRVRRRAA